MYIDIKDASRNIIIFTENSTRNFKTKTNRNGINMLIRDLIVSIFSMANEHQYYHVRYNIMMLLSIIIVQFHALSNDAYIFNIVSIILTLIL